jgi:enoyl-CoA hydratase
MSDVVAPVLRLERDGRVARLIVGSGVRRNALSSGGWAGIARAVRQLAGKDAIEAVVLEGAAAWFCAGSDIREWEDASPEDVELSFELMEAACSAIEELPVPVIAKVRGPAAGAGCQLALACDIRILAAGATMGMPIARLGILVSPAFANRLAAHGGDSVARELLYTGRMVRAQEAVRLGMANASVPGEQLDHSVEALVDAILRMSGASVRAAKRVLRELGAPARATALAMSGPPVDDGDFRRGVDHFVHRRRHRAARVAS